jgi:hypothetical protein
MSYKMTRKKNKLTYRYHELTIVVTTDEKDDDSFYIDIVYPNTDVGLQYTHGKNEEYSQELAVMESYCLGYHQAMQDKLNQKG